MLVNKGENMNKPKIDMNDLKFLPKYFVEIERYKKNVTIKADEKYKEYREIKNEQIKNNINEEITDLTNEYIFLNELSNMFDGNYISTFYKLHTLISNTYKNLYSQVNILNGLIQTQNIDDTKRSEILSYAKTLKHIKSSYELQHRYLSPLLTSKSRNNVEVFYREKFAEIANSLVSLDAQKHYEEEL